MSKDRKNQAVVYLQALANELGRTPQGKEFHVQPDRPCGLTSLTRWFGSYNQAVLAAGLVPNGVSRGTRMITCGYCGKGFERRVCRITEMNYCSQSCAAKYNNRLYPKRRKRVYRCLECGVEISAGAKKCQSCYSVDQRLDLQNLTLGQLYQRRGGKYARRNAHSAIRSWARKPRRAGACSVCGYNKHTEVCHIQDICSFPESVTIAEINHPSNLVELCRNCHWELDHGFLVLGD